MFLFSFGAVCELQLVSYDRKHALQSLFDTTFCVSLKVKSKTTEFLQLYYAPDISPTTQDAYLCVLSSKAVINHLQAMILYIQHCVIILYASICMTTELRTPVTILHTKWTIYYQKFIFL